MLVLGRTSTDGQFSGRPTDGEVGGWSTALPGIIMEVDGATMVSETECHAVKEKMMIPGSVLGLVFHSVLLLSFTRFSLKQS